MCLQVVLVVVGSCSWACVASVVVACELWVVCYVALLPSVLAVYNLLVLLPSFVACDAEKKNRSLESCRSDTNKCNIPDLSQPGDDEIALSRGGRRG